ncbi:MAG TPA: ABC transporter permease [Chloroflexia bacterium]|nr:ABC transporter permease [Chloroflexia bacterium]
MNLFEVIKVALTSLASNKLRAFLTMLGIIIGVGSVITLSSIGAGVVDKSLKQIQRNGTNLITIQPASQTVNGVRLQTQNSNLTLEDAEAVADQTRVTAAAAVAPEYRSGGQLVYGSKNTFGQAVGTTAAYPAVRDWNLAQGEWFADNDVTQAKTVVVLGSTVATNLFGDSTSEIINQSIQLNRVKFTVVGVMETKGGTGFGSLDNQVYVPITTAQQRLFGQRQAGATGTGKTINDILVKATGTGSVNEAIGQITDLLRERHEIGTGQQDDFEIVNQQDLLQTAKDQEATYTLFLLVIASISLLVGGIGIMNIMLVTVTERTREIGIRKAIGARPFDILLQFMVESVTICFFGGLLGAVIGVVASIIVGNNVATLPTLLSLSTILIAVGFAVGVGVFFGIYPAQRASRLNPIDALRYE